MSVKTVAQLLGNRPAAGRFQEQLFWLVDLIAACKASGDADLTIAAPLVEEALSSLGDYLETGDTASLERANAHIEHFAKRVKAAVIAREGT